MGNAGWCRVDGWGALSGPLYVRFQEIDGLPRVTELYMDGRGKPVPAAELKRINLGVLEESIGPEVIASNVMRAPGVDLSVLASYFATTFNPKRIRHWVADSLNSQIGQYRELYEIAAVSRAPEKDDEHREPIPTISAPIDGLTPGFLSDVDRVYRAAIAAGQSPTKLIAEQTGHGVRTVERWIYQARKRGIMAPASRRGRII